MEIGKCILCNASATVNTQDNASRTIYNCQNCGVFVVSDLVLSRIKRNSCELAAYFSHRKLANHNEIVLIASDKLKKDKDYLQLTVDQILSKFPHSFMAQLDMALLNLAYLSAYAGDEVKIDRLDLFPIFAVKKPSYDAMSFMIKAMQKMDLVEVNYYGKSFFPCGVVVTANGWARVSHLEEDSLDTGNDTVFILYSEKKDSEKSGFFLKTATKAAKECGFHVIDSPTLSSRDTVNHELIATIKNCRFVISDFSTPTGVLYYTLGMASALGKTNILTCYHSSVKRLELDSEHIGVLTWKDEEGLYLQIRNAIQALI